MKQPVLLCFNLSADLQRKVRLAAMRFKILFRSVNQEAYGQTLNALCGLEPAKENKVGGEGFADPMLIMAHFPSSLYPLFLKTIRQAGVGANVLKAVLTPTNGEWDCRKLHSELMLERQALKHGQQTVHTPDAT